MRITKACKSLQRSHCTNSKGGLLTPPLVAMAEGDGLVEQLQKELKHEALSRQLQEELNSKLQDEYDELLKRLAEAELHIDRMRLGANVDFNKYFIIRHHREQHSTLRQRLEAQFDPAWRKLLQQGDDDATKPAVKSTGVGTEGSPVSHQDTTNFGTDHENEDEHQTKGSSSGVQNGSSSNVAANRCVPLSPHIADSSGNSSRELANESSLQSASNDASSRSLNTSASALDSSSSMHFNAHHMSNGFRGLRSHQDGHSESQEVLLLSSNLSPLNSLTRSQLSSSHPSSLHLNSTHHHASATSSHPSSPSHDHLSSSHGHTSSSYTSTDNASLSKMSASAIEIRGSMESLQLAHLFKVHGLQEELEHLKSMLNDRSVPLSEVVQDASRIHQEHQQLTRDVEALSTNLDALRNKNNGKVTERIARSRRAIENELAKLAEQLQDVYEVLHARAEEEKQSLPLPNSPLSPIEKRDSDCRLSSAPYDSLNSPYLPTKYLNHGEPSTDNQLQSPQGPPMSNGRRSLSPGALFPSLSSTPLESNSSAHLTNGVIDNQQLSNLKKDSLLSGTHSCQSQDGDIGNIGSRSGENTPGDSDSSTPLEQLIELGASGQRREEPNTLSDLSDEEGELSVHVHVPEDSADTCDRSPSPLDLSQRMIPVPSPDSLYLQEAKKNLKQAEELGYSGSSHPDSRSSRDDYSSQSDNRTTAQSRDDLSPTLDPALTNERRNTLSLPLSSLEKPSQIPRLIPSQHSPRPRYRRPHSSHYPRQQAQYSSNATMTTTPANVGGGASMSKDQSGMTYPGEGDSGFAGSEFPSRTATRMDASIPTRSLASSMLQSTTSEDDANQQRFLEASAAIEALRKELADLKLQMMRNVKHSDSVPRTPSSHSHNSIPRSPPSRSHSTIKGPPSPTITTSRLTSHEYPSNSSQPKLLSREFSSYPSASNLSLHRIETPSSNHALTNGRRSSQMTTTSLTTNNTHAHVPSSQSTLSNGGRSTQMTTNDINTDTPTHSSKSTTSPTHTYSSRGSSTTAVTEVDLTPKSSPGTSRQPSSVRLSTPALSSYATLKSTPVPTPQHSVTGRTMSEASFHRPTSIASGRYNAGPRVPANGYASSSNTSSHLVNQVPRYDSASDQYDNDSVRYHPSSQATSDATAPSTIRRMNARGSVNHYRPPTYEEAKMIPSYSNRATASSSFAVPSAVSVPVEPSDTEGCATEIDPGCTSDNGCPHCGDRDAQVSRNESRSSYGSKIQRRVYAPSNNANHLHKQSQSHHSAESRGARVDATNSLVQSDRETGQRPYVGSVSASSVMSFNGAQTPMATSTPSRRNAVLNSRHIHAQAPYYARDKLSERFRTSRDSSEGENTRGAGMPTSSNIPTKSVASKENNFPRYSSTAASRSPPNEGKRLSEDYTIYSTHGSPVRSCASGYGSGVSSSAQSSPGRGYSNTRRASSPALYTTARKKSYREQIVKKPSRVRHSDNNMGGYSEDSCSDSGGERHLDRYQDAYTSSEGHGEVCATRDDRTPHVHVHVPTSARRVSIRRRKPPPYRDDHYSDTETSPEHGYGGHTKPRVVRVIKTPKLRKKQVVYLASQDPPPEEIYYSESGSELFTPRQVSHGRRVVGVVERRNGRRVSRGEGVKVAELRGSRPRKIYVEQPSEPVKKVYIVEQESESDLEQFEAIEMREVDLDDTLQLAHELKRRSKRLHGTLQAELERQAFH